MSLFWILLGGAYLFSMLVQTRMRAAYQKWGTVRNAANISGARTALVMLQDRDVRDVGVQPIPGRLSDHYDPRTKTIGLSEPIYGVHSVAAMAVAAHETGHAFQDHDRYWPLTLRTAFSPLAALAARYGVPAAVVGLLFGVPTLIQIGIVAYVASFAFQLLTLPLEFDASKRAIAELDRLRMVSDQDRAGVQSVLSAAAMTYVAGTASSAVYIFYLALFVGRWVLRRPAQPLPQRLP